MAILVPGVAQKSRDQLEQEKRRNLQRLQQAEKILNETEVKKKASLGQLQAVQNQIRAREAVVSSMRKEIDFLEEEIGDISIVVNSLERDLRNLKTEYAEMVYQTYKANQGYNLLTFLFSSKTFNQLLRRLEYMDQYGEARKEQAAQIELVTEELIVQQGEVRDRRKLKGNLLTQQLEENQKLLALKKKQGEVVTQLAGKEAELRTELNKRRSAIAKLDDLIAKTIRSSAASTNTIAAVADSRDFETLKKRLSWPVQNGFISSRFGRQPHPVLTNIEIENHGVGIQTKEGELVRAVSTGVVTAVAKNSPLQDVVMIRHGQYLTVYARLQNVLVKKGDEVKMNDPVGEVFTDPNGVSEVEFQIWKKTSRLDPEQWLAGR